MGAMDKNTRDEIKKKLDEINKQIAQNDTDNPPVRNFAENAKQFK